MITTMSNLFLRTLREDPADAEVPSHKLLVRAGYVRRVAPGIFTWLPLGYQVLRNVERIVREEMDRSGAQEVHFPALLPREAYEATGRWEEYGDNLFRLKDRKESDYLLGPTHEEMFTLLVKGEYSSYKDLPVSLYQIQTKYRDEARPRAGILRGREFVMKDSYSFDIDQAGLEASYLAHRDAYIAIFDRLGLDYVIVSATSGAMGGSASEEFLATGENGEDTFVRCANCDYAANIEAVTVSVPVVDEGEALPEPAIHPTPDTTTIESLVEFSNSDSATKRESDPWTAADTLKNVALIVTNPDGTEEPLVIGVPGNRDVDERRLEAVLAPAEMRTMTDDDLTKYPALVAGYIGPQILGEESITKIKYLVDPRVVDGTVWISGANQANHHTYGLVAGRDFTPDGTIDVADVREGDPCPDCGGALTLARGIEIGHIFQLGTKYAEALDLQVLDQNGKQTVVTMGSYGVGVSRAVAAIAEQSHDDIGLIWPPEVAPAQVHLVATGKDDAVFEAAQALADEFDIAGLTVLYDDRPKVSPGVKFKDAELLGMPVIVVVGRKLEEGLVEVRDRRTDERKEVAPSEALAAIQSFLD